MLEVSRSVRHPTGRVPLFGDQDSGRVLPAGFGRPATHDNLLDLGAALLELRRQRAAPPHEEVAWTFGVASWCKLAARKVDTRPPTTAFPVGGLYVLRDDRAHMVVRWGGVGQNGNGGHAHNDLSSYELSYGEPIVIDSGSYVYTADVAARNAFRSAAAHNVAVIDGLDMHPIPPERPFSMPAHARFKVEEWRDSEDTAVLTGSHDGFNRAGAVVRCRRRVTLDRAAGVIEVADEAQGTGHHSVESQLHLAPHCDVTLDGSRWVVRSRANSVGIEFTGATSVHVEEGWVSSHYGAREAAPVIRASVRSQLPATISYRIGPV
jgi:hypothetical protein